VQTALEMRDAVHAALPAEAAVMVAAVADWRADYAPRKIKKGTAVPVLRLVENPDILAEIAAAPDRPRLIVGFAAETDDVHAHAQAKRARKACDWIVANDVSGDVMGGEANQVLLVTEEGGETWERMSKADVARRLMERIAAALA
jgi:phosphopantothenoylcysteine decarboxylase / phosphopantothenate---cysteine ligase